MPARRKPSITIGDVAGVTVRAVRHYHQRGILPEPARDASGYRRYDAQAVVDLVRIKALSEAGVPLARVRELLEAEPDEFAAALAEIDAKLRDEVRRLEAHRVAVGRLASADALALPTEVVDYLSRLRGHGISGAPSPPNATPGSSSAPTPPSASASGSPARQPCSPTQHSWTSTGPSTRRTAGNRATPAWLAWPTT
jgi:DNA-binding transcriptional MerR regulator